VRRECAYLRIDNVAHLDAAVLLAVLDREKAALVVRNLGHAQVEEARHSVKVVRKEEILDDQVKAHLVALGSVVRAPHETGSRERGNVGAEVRQDALGKNALHERHQTAQRGLRLEVWIERGEPLEVQVEAAARRRLRNERVMHERRRVAHCNGCEVGARRSVRGECHVHLERRRKRAAGVAKLRVGRHTHGGARAEQRRVAHHAPLRRDRALSRRGRGQQNLAGESARGGGRGQRGYWNALVAAKEERAEKRLGAARERLTRHECDARLVALEFRDALVPRAASVALKCLE
jgi:hypothetical protein